MQLEFLPSSTNAEKFPGELFEDACMLGVVLPRRVPTWLITRSFPFDLTKFDKLRTLEAVWLVVTLLGEEVKTYIFFITTRRNIPSILSLF